MEITLSQFFGAADVRRALVLNSGPIKTFEYPRHAPSFANGGRRSRALKSRRWLSFRSLWIYVRRGGNLFDLVVVGPPRPRGDDPDRGRSASPVMLPAMRTGRHASPRSFACRARCWRSLRAVSTINRYRSVQL
jgi:hypothetical protein